jgi:uncharacterized membrane protein
MLEWPPRVDRARKRRRRLLPLHFNWRVEAHPIIVHFGVALLCVAFLFDLIGVLGKIQSFRTAGLYTLVAGAVGTGLSVLSGLWTPESREREGGGAIQPHLPTIQSFFSGRRVEIHKHWGYVLLALVILWLAVRIMDHLHRLRRPALAMVAGALTLIVLVITGYYGGELVYRERERGGHVGYTVPSHAIIDANPTASHIEAG